MDPWIRFDTGPLGSGTVFERPRRMIRADTADQVAGALADLERAQADGYWLAGYLSYELGYALTPRLGGLLPEARQEPLLLFGVFDAPAAAAALPQPTGVRIGRLRPLWSPATYREAIGRIDDYLHSGDAYQVNLTFAMEAEVVGTPEALYSALVRRQPVTDGAFCMLGGPAILSRSPELFFAVDEAGTIETRPMKGTRPRGATGSADAAARDDLATSDKDRAENLMIVDLLRNDLGRVCQLGSVTVPRLFQIDSFATVHQMTSTVRGHLAPGMGFTDIVTALFPCGSVTGAPKIRAMEIIAELEPGPRGIYCGAIGWVDPAGPMRFNVAIRTPVLQAGHLRLHVGGGIVADSDADAEWKEALWKSTFVELPRPD